jgi:uncharacterized protein YjbI with pentapeptide repeats
MEMLKNFFKLDPGFEKYDESRLIRHFRTSNDLQNVLYEPDHWPEKLLGRTNATFRNVSFSKTTFKEVTFRDCLFEDCLFIGAQFDATDFHNCEIQELQFF